MSLNAPQWGSTLKTAVRNNNEQGTSIYLADNTLFAWLTWTYDSRFTWTRSRIVAQACFPQGAAAQSPVWRRNARSCPHLPTLPTRERAHTPLWPLLCCWVTWEEEDEERERHLHTFSDNSCQKKTGTLIFQLVRMKTVRQENLTSGSGSWQRNGYQLSIQNHKRWRK